jgi:hypothetical protein
MPDHDHDHDHDHRRDHDLATPLATPSIADHEPVRPKLPAGLSQDRFDALLGNKRGESRTTAPDTRPVNDPREPRTQLPAGLTQDRLDEMLGKKREPGDISRFDELASDRTVAAPASATSGGDADERAGDRVQMNWAVNYNLVAGKTKGFGARTGSTQLIVEELKIDPDGKEKPQYLHGGNLAKSGSAQLGDVSVPKGSGTVSAAVQYANTKKFTVTLEVTPALNGAAGRRLLKAKEAEAKKAIEAQIEHRGDYKRIARDVEEKLAPAFEGRVVTVTMKPLGGGDTHVAEAATYSVDEDSSWEAVIDPTERSASTVTWSQTSTQDSKRGESEESGTKLTTGVDTSAKVKKATKFVQSFNESVKVNVQAMVKNIEEAIVKADSNESKTESKQTTWTVGGGTAAKQDDDAKGAGDTQESDSSGGGFIDKIKRTVTSGAKWVFNKGVGVVKRIWIVKDILDIAGDIWDKLTGTVKIERKSMEGESETKTKGSSVSIKDAREITDSTAIASELTRQFTAETSQEVESLVSTRYGVELSKLKKTDESAGRSTTKTVSGSTVTVEMGRPKVHIRRVQ